MRRFGLTLLGLMALVGSAAAADMPVKVPVKAPVVVPLYNWTGFYVGGNVGYSWGKQDNSLVTGGVTVFTNSDSINGIIGGGQIGYNWQFNQIVLGVEADFQGSGQKGDGTFTLAAHQRHLSPISPASTIAYTDKLDWFGTVRGRIGYAFDRWLPYVTGGWAYGHGSMSGSSTGGIVTTFSGSNNYSGWTVGGGLEYAFMDHWSAKAEYLYINFGNGPTIAITPVLNLVSGRMTDNIARLGINYKF